MLDGLDTKLRRLLRLLVLGALGRHQRRSSLNALLLARLGLRSLSRLLRLLLEAKHNVIIVGLLLARRLLFVALLIDEALLPIITKRHFNLKL